MKATYTPTRTVHVQSICKVFLFICLLTITQNATATIRYVSQWGSGSGTSWSDASGVLKAMIDASQQGNRRQAAVAIPSQPETGNREPITMLPGFQL